MPVAAQIYYTTHGADGKLPVVLLHGAVGSYLSWPPQIRRLPGYAMFALDLPGHGKSDGEGSKTIAGYADRVLAWMHVVGLHAAVFIGHSMGSAVALKLAIDYPEYVSGLGLLGSAAHLKVNPTLIQESADESTFNNAIEKIVAWSFSRKMPEHLKAIIARRMDITSSDVLHGDLIACDQYDSSANLNLVRCPTLVLSGSEDKMTPVRMAIHLAEQIPTARLEIIPDAGHMVMLECPEHVEASLANFLAGIPR